MLARPRHLLTRHRYSQQRVLLHSSTTKQKQRPPGLFPYPTARNPSPHQIFHLPQNASQTDIKERYFDLVRIYHPDKAGSSLSPDEAHARFRSITTAYDALRGKTPPPFSPSSPQDPRHPTTAAWRAMQTNRRSELYSSAAVDDRWKDRVILAGVVLAIALFVAQNTATRWEALADAAARNQPPKYNARDQESLAEDERLAADPSDQGRKMPE